MRLLLGTSALAAALLLAGCGTPGAPLPPSLDLPQPPGDLKATRKGDKVTLTWTVPAQTNDRALVKHAGVTRVCRGPQPAMSECAHAVGELPAAQLQPGKPATYTDVLLPQQMGGGVATYAVEAQNDRGRSAGLSNQVQVPLAPTLPAPADVRAQVTANGPTLAWTPSVAAPAGARYLYRVSRSVEGAEKSSAIGDVPLATGGFTDPAFAWEAHYVYRVTPITVVEQAGGEVEIEGDDSAPVAVFAHDVFPPAVPTGVQAVYSGLAQQKFIDLTWAPDTDADLAGYNVYRRSEGEGGAPVRISSEPAKTPAFRDANLQPGRKYLYSVSAVDVRGNESARSAEAAESVPQ